MDLASLDLNLLLVLHTVLSERSVARAAERLHVTSSAISNALARLRSSLGDPLVTRKGRGIVATPRALELQPALARALEGLEGALRRAPFDAASCARTFTLALADAGQVAWLPRIAGQLAREMPVARLRVVGIDSLVALGDLGSSEVDVQIGVPAKLPGVHVDRLFEERLVLVARADHPLAGKRLSATELGSLRHVAVELVPGKHSPSTLAAAYGRAGIRRDVALSVPTFAAAAAIAAQQAWVATLPESLLELLGAPLGLQALNTPLPPLAVPIAMCWHERTHTEPALVAFRDLIRAAFRAAPVATPPLLASRRRGSLPKARRPGSRH